jgi:hypothetical protein
MFLNGIKFFLKEREEVKDDKWPSHPVTVKTDKNVKETFIWDGCFLMIRMVEKRIKYELGNRKIWPQIWTWEKSGPRWCQRIRTKNINWNRRNLCWHFGKNKKRIRFLKQYGHLWCNLAVTMRSRSEMAVSAREINSFLKTNGIKNVRIQNQDSASYYLHCYRNCDWVCSTWSNNKSEVLRWAFVQIAGKNSKKDRGIVGDWLDFTPAQRPIALLIW